MAKDKNEKKEEKGMDGWGGGNLGCLDLDEALHGESGERMRWKFPYSRWWGIGRQYRPRRLNIVKSKEESVGGKEDERIERKSTRHAACPQLESFHTLGNMFNLE